MNEETLFELPHFTLSLKPPSTPLPIFPKEIPAFYVSTDAIHLQEIQELAASLRSRFEAALVIGIGGSHLGGETLVSALTKSPEDFPLHWLNNVDPPAMQAASQFIEKQRTATVIISKSGSTLETLAGFFHLSHRLDPEGYTVITDPHQGELGRLAKQNHWRALAIPEALGGRFSVLSPVGLLPAALQGVNIDLVVKGAKESRDHLAAAPIDAAASFAKAAYDWDKNGFGIQYLMPYWSSLATFSHWYVQLWAESLGKLSGGSPGGPTPVAALGSRDQHSLLQNFQQGSRNKVIGFIDILESEERFKVGKPSFETEGFDFLPTHHFDTLNHLACRATRECLREEKIPTYLITLKKLTPEAVGSLIFFFEMAVAYSAELYGVSAYDQPGVEKTKQIWKKSLTR